jgi:hypothetical protein
MAVMPMPREKWTDERLDDLNERVGRLEVRMDAGFEEMRREFAAIRQEVSGLSRMVAQLFVTMMIGFIGVITAVLTQT